jgi:hypothetical protein
MDLREIDWESVEWIQLAQDRDSWRDLVNAVMKLRVLDHVISYCVCVQLLCVTSEINAKINKLII